MSSRSVYCRCGEEIDPQRLNRGLVVCEFCGEDHAQKKAEARKLQTAPLYNKGPYGYITESTDFKSLGRKV